jgi:hypothetical protein
VEEEEEGMVCRQDEDEDRSMVVKEAQSNNQQGEGRTLDMQGDEIVEEEGGDTATDVGQNDSTVQLHDSKHSHPNIH